MEWSLLRRSVLNQGRLGAVGSSVIPPAEQSGTALSLETHTYMLPSGVHTETKEGETYQVGSETVSERKVYHTADLGWVAGTDVSSDVTDFINNTVSAGDQLIVDAFYKISGSGYTFPAGFTMTGGLSNKAAGFECIDGIQAVADYYGETINNDAVFEVGANTRIENLRLTQATFDPLTLLGGGIKEAWFKVDGVDNFTFLNNWSDCVGWNCVSLEGSDNAYFEGNYFDSLKAGINISGGDNLRFIRNVWTGGYIARNIGDTANQVFGDGIKTIEYSEALTNPIVTGNLFFDGQRDAIDTTGGFKDATVSGNAFQSLTAIDIKSQYDDSSTPSVIVENTGISITGNCFVSSLIVLTTEFLENYSYDADMLVQDINSSGNYFLGGDGASAWLFKDCQDVSSNGDYYDGVRVLKMSATHASPFGLQFDSVNWNKGVNNEIQLNDSGVTSSELNFTRGHLTDNTYANNQLIETTSGTWVISGLMTTEVSMSVTRIFWPTTIASYSASVDTPQVVDVWADGEETPDLNTVTNAESATGVTVDETMTPADITTIVDWIIAYGAQRKTDFTGAF